MIEEAVQQYLAGRRVVVGELVHAGWLVFRIVSEGPPAELESLDFKSVASFTKDLSEAEAICAMQTDMLRRHSVEEEPCTLRHTAIVSKSYVPNHPNAFMKRDAAAKDHSSGWYVGVLDDPLCMEDASSFFTQSLYELSIADRRMLPYWPMPLDTLVSLDLGVIA